MNILAAWLTAFSLTGVFSKASYAEDVKPPETDFYFHYTYLDIEKYDGRDFAYFNVDSNQGRHREGLACSYVAKEMDFIDHSSYATADNHKQFERALAACRSFTPTS